MENLTPFEKNCIANFQPIYRVMYQMNPECFLKTEDYMSRESAVKDANELFTRGFYCIDLYHKTRNGWFLEKRVKQNPLVCKAKQAAVQKAAVDSFNEYCKELFG